MVLKNAYLKGHLLVTASKWKWFYDFQALWEIVKTWSFKCCVKYKKHLKRLAECAKNISGGLNFSTNWKLKASKFKDDKQFRMYFFGPF